MEDDLARTLAELERKLVELERTLHSIAAAEAAPPEAAHRDVTEPALRAGAHTAPEPPAPRAGPGGDWGRIVDETLEPAPGVAPPAPAPPSGPGPAAPSAPGPPPPAPAPAPPAPGPPPPHRHPRSPLPPVAPRPPHAPHAPSASELLRFRERLERAAHDLTEDYDQLLGRLSYAAMPVTTSTISFARGVPSLDIIDVDGLRDAAVRAFDSDPGGMTAYGTAVGYPRLRAWIADRHGVEPERVLLTNGSLQADAFLFDHLLSAGDEVIVESPTYDRTLLSLRERGTRVHPVRLAPDGIDTDELARVLAQGARPKLAHIIPNFQNPAGYTLSELKRRALIELAAEHDFLVLEDDPYADLRFSGEPMPTMLSMDPERVVYASSFTKTVCPGVRVGYLVGPPTLIGEIARRATNTYISPGMVSESIVYEFCASGALERSIETVRTALHERASALAAALSRELAEAEFEMPQGGYFMWVSLPEGTDVHELFTAAAERGVAFVKGTDFLLSGGGNTLRLAYSGVTPEQIDAGIARLAEAYRSL